MMTLYTINLSIILTFANSHTFIIRLWLPMIIIFVGSAVLSKEYVKPTMR